MKARWLALGIASFFFLFSPPILSSLQFGVSFSLSFSLLLLSGEGLNHRASVLSVLFSSLWIGRGWFLLKNCPSSFEQPVQVKSTYDCWRERANRPGRENKAVFFSSSSPPPHPPLPRFMSIAGAVLYPVFVKCSP